VFLHDETGDGRAAMPAVMSLLLRGESGDGTVAGGGASAQRPAIRQLGEAMRPGRGPLPGNPASAARRDSW
jgi:hypothetical protein